MKDIKTSLNKILLNMYSPYTNKYDVFSTQ